MLSYPLFHSLSLSHLPLTSSSPTLSPLHLHLPQLFISYGFFHLLPLHLPHLFISLIDCTINLLFKLSTTHYPTIGVAALEIFFTPYASMVVCVWKMQFFFFLFCSLIWFVDFVVCVITRFVVFIFIFFIGFVGSEPWIVVLWWLVFFFPFGFLIGVVCFVLWSN